MSVLDYIWAGILAVFMGGEAFSIFGIAISITLVMIVLGFLIGIITGATPGLSGPFLMAISLPILISIFGFNSDALLPVFGFLVGVMKGSTVGGAVPAILFNTPGTPDAMLTTLDGYPMAKKGEAKKALKVAHFASASGDTFSDIVLFTCAPFLAIMVESHLGFNEKAALIILSLSFVAAVVGSSPLKGVMAACLGLFVATIGTGEDGYSRLSMGSDALTNGIPLIAAVLGVLILGEVLFSIEEMWKEHRDQQFVEKTKQDKSELTIKERISLLPYIGVSSVIGTIVGALPGIGSTLAATLGYATGQKIYKGKSSFGEGVPAGVAATEAANSSVSGANLIPVLSLGIPGNVGAVFLVLAADSIGGFNPGPSVFRFTENEVNPELIIAFGLFTSMAIANLLNWTLGGRFMRLVGVMIKIPKSFLMPFVLLLTLTAIYVQETNFNAILFAMAFGFLGYFMRKLQVPTLPFVIAFILEKNLEVAVRQAFSVSDANPFFLLESPISISFLLASLMVIIFFSRSNKI